MSLEEGKNPNGGNRQGFEAVNVNQPKGNATMTSLALNTNFVKTMSSREIAELTGKEHYNVKRDCNVMFSELGLDALKFEGIYFDAQNRQQTEYLLTFELVQTLITGYSIKLRFAVIQRLNELENQVSKPTIQSPKKPSELSSAFRSCMSIAKLCGLKGNQAILSADRATRKLTGESPLELLEITHLHAPVQEQVFTPTQIGEMLNPKLSGQKVNKLLAELGYQVKEGEFWLMTEKGKSLGELMDTQKRHSDGTPVKQLKWYQSIVACLDMEKAA